jgi:hypothetical protein
MSVYLWWDAVLQKEQILDLDRLTTGLSREVYYQKNALGWFTVFFGIELLNQKYVQKYPRLQLSVSTAALVPLLLGGYYYLLQ